MKKKSIICITLLFILCLSVACFSSCSTANDGRKKIVVTIFPEYDWMENVLGEQKDRFNIILLQKNSADLHNFDPGSEDLVNISMSDLFIYVGGESDEWVEDALKNPVNGDRKALSLMEILGDKAREEETVEGMEGEEEEEEESETEYDEHVWLSLSNARLFVSAIADALCELDETNAQTYRTNADGYNAQLTALDEEYKTTIAGTTVKTLVFGDRFPFLYMFKDYGLTYYAAFKGCSAESEASFETIVFLSKKVDELGLKNIWTIEGSDGKIARTVRDNTTTKDQTIRTLNSLQSGANGQTYLSAMRSNLEILKQGL